MEAERETRLWELYYGLLSAEEAAELRSQIASDPLWADLWAQVQQKAALVAEAARVHMDRLPLPSGEPDESAEPAEAASGRSAASPVLYSESVRAGRASGGAKPSAKPASGRRGERWPVGVVYISTSLLLLAALWGAMVHRHYLLALTGEHLRLVVQGPSVLRQGVENQFLVLTCRVDGQPVESQVELALFGPDEKRFFCQKETSDAQGQVRVVVPDDMDLPPWVDLRVQAEAGGKQESRQVRLEVAPLEYETFLGLDRLCYRPGEKVFFRSVSAPRFPRRIQEEMWVEFEVRDAEDRPVPGFHQEGRTWQGVGCGHFPVPPDMPPGLYVLVARNPQRRFPEVRKPFYVVPSENSPVQIGVEFQKPPYRPGQTVTAEIHLAEQGQPARQTTVELRAELVGQVIHRDSLRTDDQGRCRSVFRLPDRIKEPDAWLWVKLPSGQPPRIICRPIPLAGPKIRCRFYPEGGLLVPGVENRVYFSVRDAQGRPVEVRGRLVDLEDRQITEVHTNHLGRGVFQFIPQKDQQYQFRILEPEGLPDPLELPRAVGEQKVMIKSSLAVVGPGQPLQFQLLSTSAVKNPLPLMAAVVCRGVQAAQQWVALQIREEGESNETPVQIPLPHDLWGLMHLRIYDYSQSPPILVAQRLFYRLPQQRLRVELGLPEQPWHPLDRVQLRLSTKDESGSPISTIAGLAVVEETFLHAMPGLTPIAPFWWLDELWEIPEDLEQAAEFLTDRPESRQALDLLLGTWAGRLTPPDEEAPGPRPDQAPGQTPVTQPPGPEDAPPLVVDNLRRIQASYQKARELFQQARPETLNAITLSSLLGGAGLLLFVLLATLLQVSGGARIWIPALLGASICVGVGLVLAHPEFLRSRSPYALPFAEYPQDESETALSDGKQGSRPGDNELKTTFSGSSLPPTPPAAAQTQAAPSGRLPLHPETALVQPFGVPRTTLCRLLSLLAPDPPQPANPPPTSSAEPDQGWQQPTHPAYVNRQPPSPDQARRQPAYLHDAPPLLAYPDQTNQQPAHQDQVRRASASVDQPCPRLGIPDDVLLYPFPLDEAGPNPTGLAAERRCSKDTVHTSALLPVKWTGSFIVSSASSDNIPRHSTPTDRQTQSGGHLSQLVFFEALARPGAFRMWDHKSVAHLPKPLFRDPPGKTSALLAAPSGSRFVVREYAYRAFRAGTTGNLPASEAKPAPKSPEVGLLYWHPFFVIGPEGSAQCQFDLPARPGVFRIRADLLDSEGQMHLAEAKIVTRPPPAKPSSVPEKPPKLPKPQP